MKLLSSWLIALAFLVSVPLMMAAAPKPAPSPVLAQCTCVATEGTHQISIFHAGGQTQGVALTPEGDGECNEECSPVADKGCKWKAEYKIGWPAPQPGAFTSSGGKKSIRVPHGGGQWDAAEDTVRFKTGCATSVAHDEKFTSDATGQLLATIVFNGDCNECKEPEGP